MTAGGVAVGSGYSLAGRLAEAYDAEGREILGVVIRCRSCGCLLLAGDQGVHEDHHARLDKALAARMTDAEIYDAVQRAGLSCSRRNAGHDPGGPVA